MSNPAVAYVGDYSFSLSDLDDNGRKRYVMAVQRGKPVLDKELTETAYRGLEFVRRYLERNIGDCALGANSFKIMENVADNSSNFKVLGGTSDKPAVLVLKGFPLVLFGDITYKQQGSGGSLTDDYFTNTTIPAISVPVAPRVDTVYIDMYLAEVSSEPGSEYQDSSIKDPSLAIQSANRFRIVQDFLVAEGTTSIPADGLDANNVYHRYIKLAEIQRRTSDPQILQADITDKRLPIISPDGGTTIYQQGVSTLESLSNGTGNLDVDNVVIEDDLTVHGTVTIIDQTHVHQEKLTITCDTASTDAVTINKSLSGDGIVINKSSGTGYAIHVTAGTSKLSSLSVNSVDVDEFSNDGTLAGNSDLAVPTEKAVKTYVDYTSGGGFGTTNQIARFVSPTVIRNSNLNDDNVRLLINLVTVFQDTSLGSIGGQGYYVRNVNLNGFTYLRAEGPFPSSGLSLNAYLDFTAGAVFGITKARTNHLLSTNDANALFIEQQSNKPIYIGNNGICAITVNSVGHVGIGGTFVPYPFCSFVQSYFGSNVGIMVTPTVGLSLNVYGMSFFSSVLSGGVSLSDNTRASQIVTHATATADPGKFHWSLGVGSTVSDLRWRIGLINTDSGNAGSDLIINRRNSGNDVKTLIIKRDTGCVGIGTTDNAGSPFTSTLTLFNSSNNTLQLIGTGPYNSYGTIYWSDANTYLQEYSYSRLKFAAYYGMFFDTYIGINTESDINYRLKVNSNAYFTDDTYIGVKINDVDTISTIVTENVAGSDSNDYVNAASIDVLNDLIPVVNVYEYGETVRIHAPYGGNLPSPLVEGVDYYVLAISPGWIALALTKYNAIHSIYIDITDQGTGVAYDVLRRKHVKHFTLSSGFGTSAVRWTIGLLSTEEGSDTGSDLCIRHYDDTGNIKSRVMPPITIKRSVNWIGIYNADPEYLVDIGDPYSDQWSRISGNLYVGSLYPTTSAIGLPTIGDAARFFNSGYITDMAIANIRGKFISEGGNNNLTVNVQNGQFVTVSAGPGTIFGGGAHWQLWTDFYPSNLRWGFNLINSESGANTGSDLYLLCYDDAGAILNVAIRFKRSTGYVGIAITTDPFYALDVGASVRFQATAYVGSLQRSTASSSIGTQASPFFNAYVSSIYTSTLHADTLMPRTPAEGGSNRLVLNMAAGGEFATYIPTAGTAIMSHWHLATTALISGRRWSWGMHNNETGGGSGYGGSDLVLNRSNNSGITDSTPIIECNRSTGVVSINDIRTRNFPEGYIDGLEMSWQLVGGDIYTIYFSSGVAAINLNASNRMIKSSGCSKRVLNMGSFVPWVAGNNNGGVASTVLNLPPLSITGTEIATADFTPLNPADLTNIMEGDIFQCYFPGNSNFGITGAAKVLSKTGTTVTFDNPFLAAGALSIVFVGRWLHAFAVTNIDDINSCDFGFDTSFYGSNLLAMTSPMSAARRVGSILVMRDFSTMTPLIRPFTQQSDYFIFAQSTNINYNLHWFNVQTPALQSQYSVRLLTPPEVNCKAKFIINIHNASASTVRYLVTDGNATVPTMPVATYIYVPAFIGEHTTIYEVGTSTNSKFYMSFLNGGTVSWQMGSMQLGYTDFRGKR